MKIFVSLGWVISNVIVNFAVLFQSAIIIKLLVDNPIKVDIVMMSGVIFVYALAALLLLIMTRRFLTYVKINRDKMESFIFRKSLCKVDCREKVYYAIFDGRESLYSTVKYIAVSNEPFEYYDVPRFQFFKAKKPFLSTYDIKKVIVVPYHKETIPVLPIEEWINVRESNLK